MCCSFRPFNLLRGPLLLLCWPFLFQGPIENLFILVSGRHGRALPGRAPRAVHSQTINSQTTALFHDQAPGRGPACTWRAARLSVRGRETSGPPPGHKYNSATAPHAVSHTHCCNRVIANTCFLVRYVLARRKQRIHRQCYMPIRTSRAYSPIITERLIYATSAYLNVSTVVAVMLAFQSHPFLCANDCS